MTIHLFWRKKDYKFTFQPITFSDYLMQSKKFISVMGWACSPINFLKHLICDELDASDGIPEKPGKQTGHAIIKAILFKAKRISLRWCIKVQVKIRSNWHKRIKGNMIDPFNLDYERDWLLKTKKKWNEGSETDWNGRRLGTRCSGRAPASCPASLAPRPHRLRKCGSDEPGR